MFVSSLMAESPKRIASLSPIGRAFRKVFTSSSASSVRRKAFPESKVGFRFATACKCRLRLLPTVGQDDKRYRLSPKSYVGARRFAAPTISHQGQKALLLSDCLCQWRSYRYLPYQGCQSATCRALTGLPAHGSGCDLPSAIADAKSHPEPSSQRMTDVRPKPPVDSDPHHTPGSLLWA